MHCCAKCYLGRLQSEAKEWINTPFHPRACFKNIGVDCVNLSFLLYQRAGLISKNTKLPSHYPMDGGHHLKQSLVLEFLRDLKEFRAVSKTDHRVGNLILSKMGRIEHHTSVIIQKGKVIHAIQNSGVIISELNDPTFSKRIQKIFRPTLLMDHFDDIAVAAAPKKPCACS